MGKQHENVPMVAVPVGVDFFNDVLDTVETPGKDGEMVTVQVEGIDVTSSAIRNIVSQTMKLQHADVYAECKTMKYASGKNPTLADRREAYKWLFSKFIDLTYNIAGL